MKIEVTQDLIDRGVQGDCEACPIALAILLATGAREVDIGYDGVCIGGKRRVEPGAVPDAAWQWMNAFDDGRSVEPFSFDLDLAA